MAPHPPCFSPCFLVTSWSFLWPLLPLRFLGSPVTSFSPPRQSPLSPGLHLPLKFWLLSLNLLPLCVQMPIWHFHLNVSVTPSSYICPKSYSRSSHQNSSLPALFPSLENGSSADQVASSILLLLSIWLPPSWPGLPLLLTQAIAVSL